MIIKVKLKPKEKTKLFSAFCVTTAKTNTL